MFVLPIHVLPGACSPVEQHEALHEVLMTGFVPVFAHSVDSAVGYLDIEPFVPTQRKIQLPPILLVQLIVELAPQPSGIVT